MNDIYIVYDKDQGTIEECDGLAEAREEAFNLIEKENKKLKDNIQTLLPYASQHLKTKCLMGSVEYIQLENFIYEMIKETRP